MDRAAHRNLSVPALPIVGIVVPNDASTGSKWTLALSAVKTRIIGMIWAKHLSVIYVLLVISILWSAHIWHVGEWPTDKLLFL